MGGPNAIPDDAHVLHLQVAQGTDYRLSMRFFERDTSVVPTTETPLPLAGALAELYARDANGSSVLSLTSADDAITFDTVTGTISLHLEDAVTAALPAVRAHYDFFLTLAGGDRKRHFTGRLEILRTMRAA